MTNTDLFDGKLQAIEFVLEGIERTGSSVRIRKLELEMLEHVDIVRNILMSALQCEGGDRSSLQLVFGGDCARISRTRLLLECAQSKSILLERASTVAVINGSRSCTSRADEWKACMGRCVAACESVEKVLEDLGLGFALRMAQDARAKEWEKLRKRTSAAEFPADQELQNPEFGVVECTMECITCDGASRETDDCSEPLDNSVTSADNTDSPSSFVESYLESEPHPVQIAKLEENDDWPHASVVDELTHVKQADSDDSKLLGEDVEDTSRHEQTRDGTLDSCVTQEEADTLHDNTDVLDDDLEKSVHVIDSTSESHGLDAAVLVPEDGDDSHLAQSPDIESSTDLITETMSPDIALSRNDDPLELLEASGYKDEAVRNLFGDPIEETQCDNCKSFDALDNDLTQVASTHSAKIPSISESPLSSDPFPSTSPADSRRKRNEPSVQDAVEELPRTQRRVSDVTPRRQSSQSSLLRSDVLRGQRKSFPSMSKLALGGLQQRSSLQPQQQALTDRTERRKTNPVIRMSKVFQEIGSSKKRSSSTGAVTPSDAGSDSASEVGSTPRVGYGTPGRRRSSQLSQVSNVSRKSFDNASREYDEYSIMDALEPDERDFIKQVFAVYVGPGGLSLGTGLSLSRFRRLLKDCGLINEEAGVTIGTLFPLSYDRRNSFGNKQKNAKGGGSWRTLSISQADLILSRATNAVVDGQLSLKLVNPGNLALALSDVAAYCRRSNEDLDHVASLKAFCGLYLGPLLDRATSQKEKGEDWDVVSAVALLDEPDVVGVFQRSHRRLATIFYNYAQSRGSLPPYRQGHWTAACLGKFISDAGLGRALNNSKCYRLFDEVTEFEHQAGNCKEDMLTYRGLQICVVAIAERTFKDMKPLVADRLRVLLLRLNALNADDLATFQSNKDRK